MTEKEKDENLSGNQYPAPEASESQVSADGSEGDSGEPAKSKNPLVFALLIALAAAGGYLLFSRMMAVSPPEPSAEPEAVSEELQALRRGEGATSEEAFAAEPCEGTFTHTPLGFAFDCPEGWWHPFESAEADTSDPEHFIYETAFTSMEVEGPLELGDAGSWLAIDAGTRAEVCDAAPGADSEDVEEITIDGEATYLQEVTLTDGMGQPVFSGKRVAVRHGGICYQISMFHLGGDDLNTEEDTVLAGILGSFRFNR